MDYIFRLITKVVTTAAKLSIAIETIGKASQRRASAEPYSSDRASRADCAAQDGSVNYAGSADRKGAGA